MTLESYRYEASAEFAWDLKMDQEPERTWLMLHRQFQGGEEYVVADIDAFEQGIDGLTKQHIIRRSDGKT